MTGPVSRTKNPVLIPGRPSKIFGQAPGTADILVVVILCLAAYIFYDQYFDMSLTTLHSYDLLDCIFTGKPLKFYGFAFDKASQGLYISPVYDETRTAAAYNIVVYIVLAVWELPMYIMNHIYPKDNYGTILEAWGRLLGILVTYLSYVQITKLSRTLMSDQNKAKWAGYFFLSSPLITYCVIIRNQLDIIPVLLIILALGQYFKKNYVRFSVIMAFAGCFKLIPFLIVIPLLLLAEKKIGKLIKYFSISISLYAVTNVLFLLLDPAYLRAQQLLDSDSSMSQFLFRAVIPGGTSNTSIFLLVYILICVIAYVAKPNDSDLPVYALLLGFASLSVFFLFVMWHPQWLVLLLPFITLIVFSLPDFQFGIMLDMILYFGFLITSILMHLTWFVFSSSPFFQMTSGSYSLPENYNLIYQFAVDFGLSNIIFSTLFFAGIAGLILIAFLNVRSRTQASINSFDNPYKIQRVLFYTRSALILLYIVPPVIRYLENRIV